MPRLLKTKNPVPWIFFGVWMLSAGTMTFVSGRFRGYPRSWFGDFIVSRDDRPAAFYTIVVLATVIGIASLARAAVLHSASIAARENKQV